MLAAKKIAITRWGMTLADQARGRVVKLRSRGNCCLEIGCLDFNCPEFGCPEFDFQGLGCLEFGCPELGCLEFGCPELGCLEFGCQGLGCLSFGCSSALDATASIPLALGLPIFPHFRFLAMFPAVTFIPPLTSRLAALGTAIPGLGMGGAKWFLAVFEQTKSLARPTSPLTFARFTRC